MWCAQRSTLRCWISPISYLYSSCDNHSNCFPVISSLKQTIAGAVIYVITALFDIFISTKISIASKFSIMSPRYPLTIESLRLSSITYFQTCHQLKCRLLAFFSTASSIGLLKTNLNLFVYLNSIHRRTW